MKESILFLIIATFSLAVMAQTGKKEEKKVKKIDVPIAVTGAFQKNYPSVKEVKWDAEDGDFEAGFKLNGVECSAIFNKTGQRLEFEETIKSELLPKAVLEYIQKNYATFKTVEAAKITNDKKEITYEAAVKLGKIEMGLVFDANGKFIKEEKD